MARSDAVSVADYLASLPPERRAVVAKVRDLVNASLPAGYVETMAFGMIGWGIPLARYPDTYNKQPLGYVALAAQKNNYSLYLMGVYAVGEQERKLRSAAAAAGKKLDMGKSCLRFKKAEDLPLEAIGELIAEMGVDDYIAVYEASRKR
ncbi:MAG TPA: DUF1801 domain-containing protein [Luteimonas sp.]|nr:DUF1801 domain-containing protein [Luteimonas sp.]